MGRFEKSEDETKEPSTSGSSAYFVQEFNITSNSSIALVLSSDSANTEITEKAVQVEKDAT